MNTNYQMWITHDAERNKLRLPVLPEKFTVSIGSKNSSVNVAELGEIVIKQARPAYQLSFSSFFPVGRFSGLTVDALPNPLDAVGKIKSWLESDKPVRVVLTDMGVSMFCTIENFSYYEQGGDVGTIYYDLKLKEYREVTARQVKIENVANTPTAKVSKTPERVDNSVQPQTYTVKSGDCLWNIAKKYYGKGADYTKIFNANKDKINNPNLIYPGQVLTIPA